MADTSNLSQFLTDIASAIKTKKGTTDKIPASNFDTEILSIDTIKGQEKTIIPSTTEQIITPDGDYNAITKATVKAVDNTIDSNISPENIKKDINILGIIGTLESGGSEINNQDKTITANGTYQADEGYTGLGTVTVNVPQTGDVPVKLFETKEAMQSDPDTKEGDLAVVYRSEIQNATVDSHFQVVTFPDTVVLDTAITDYVDIRYRAVDESVMFDCMGSLDSSRFRMDCYTETREVRIEYTSSDGITYTRTDTTGNPVDFGTEIYYVRPERWNDAIGKFIQVGGSTFGGLFEYSDNSWLLAPTQLSAIADYVYGKEFYGKNGVEIGTLGTPDNSFIDTNAEMVYKIQSAYNNMEPRVLTDEDKTIDTNIYFIPTKYDGTPLIDTGEVTNMDAMFHYCRNLINIPEINTSSAISMRNTFEMCTNLRNVSYIDTSKVTNMYCMFNGCDKLVSIEQMNTSMVTNMSSMFNSCRSLKTIPELDTSSVIDMKAMFSGCISLTNVPQLNTGNATDMGSLFATCLNLTEIPQLDTHSNTNMYCMFYKCNKVTSIPQLNTINVANMDSAFQDCSSITEISELNSSKVTIMQYLFSGCTNLITIPLLNTSKVTKMYNMVNKCPNLSDESLNNILAMCKNATSYNDTKTLRYLGLTSEQATKCQSLSNYSAFTSAGWTTGY